MVAFKARYTYYIPNNITRQPEQHEKSAAQILANYFRCNVRFIRTATIHTADVEVSGRIWEMKSPRGGGKRTIQHQLQRGSKQSRRIVVDNRRSKIGDNIVARRCRREFNEAASVKGLILISKTGKIILDLNR